MLRNIVKRSLTAIKLHINKILETTKPIDNTNHITKLIESLQKDENKPIIKLIESLQKDENKHIIKLIESLQKDGPDIKSQQKKMRMKLLNLCQKMRMMLIKILLAYQLQVKNTLFCIQFWLLW